MQILNEWKFKSINAGGCFGRDHWLLSQDTPVVTSINPSNGEPLTQIQACSLTDYEKIVAASHKAFLTWCNVPAPKRGELVRQMGNALRERKESLSRLVALEMGKII